MRDLRQFLPALLLAVALYLSAQTAPSLPDTSAAHQFSAWLAAFNANDRATYLAFLEKNLPARASAIDQEMNFRQRTGGFDLRVVEDSTSPTKIVALVQEHTSDQFARVTLEVAPAEPHTITLMGIRITDRPSAFALPHLAPAELAAALKTKLAQAVDTGDFSGAVLVSNHGKPIFQQACGLADRDRKTPNTLDTRFRIGSMNKMFTAVAILQLAEKGKLSLTDPVGKFLPDYPNKEVAAKVTLTHLLTHTGGTGDFFGPEFDQHRLELRTFDDYVKLFGARPLRFDPGTRWEYSNYGFLLLGLVVEKASGESYYDYVRDHIYKPAGMTATGSEPEERQVAGLSTGYTHMGAAPRTMRPNADTLPYRGTSAGGGYSTVGDLTRFAESLLQNRLLTAPSLELLTTGKPGTPNNSYAFGFEDRRFNGERCFGHGGGAPGMNGMLQICPGAGYVVAALANQDPPAAQRIVDFIVDRLPRQ